MLDNTGFGRYTPGSRTSQGFTQQKMVTCGSKQSTLIIDCYGESETLSPPLPCGRSTGHGRFCVFVFIFFLSFFRLLDHMNTQYRVRVLAGPDADASLCNMNWISFSRRVKAHPGSLSKCVQLERQKRHIYLQLSRTQAISSRPALSLSHISPIQPLTLYTQHHLPQPPHFLPSEQTFSSGNCYISPSSPTDLTVSLHLHW